MNNFKNVYLMDMNTFSYDSYVFIYFFLKLFYTLIISIRQVLKLYHMKKKLYIKKITNTIQDQIKTFYSR